MRSRRVRHLGDPQNPLDLLADRPPCALHAALLAAIFTKVGSDFDFRRYTGAATLQLKDFSSNDFSSNDFSLNDRVTMDQRTVLCYGDSNTWGFDPRTKGRFERAVRWTGVLQELLGTRVRIVEEGLNGRTTVFDDPLESGRNGLQYLGPCLESHAPIDLVVLMLGTNDLKRRYKLSAQEISLGVARLVTTVRSGKSGPGKRAPEVLLLSPPHVGPLSEHAGHFEGAEAKSKELAANYRLVAQEASCAFLDISTVVVASEVDGVHLDPDSHTAIASALADELTELLRLR